MGSEVKTCFGLDKLKDFNQIIHLTPEVKKELRIEGCKATIALYNEKDNQLMLYND